MQPRTRNRVKAGKWLWLSLLATVLPFSLKGQVSLDSCLNMPRKGDRLLKQQVVYKEPGENGIQRVWDISELASVNEDYELKYSSLGKSEGCLVGTEHHTMYYYQLRGDSLLSSGYENPTTLVKYREPETLLVFPLSYGRTFTDHFDGRGNYCNRLDIHVQGRSTVTADATGMLILPGGDTLQHVIRVHTRKELVERMQRITRKDSLPTDTLSFVLNRDSIDWYLNHAPVRIQMDTWRWYAEGYRYPVFESIRSTVRGSEKQQDYLTVSFYYPPQEQYYGLEDDPENRMRRERATRSKNNFRNTCPPSGKDENTYKDDLIRYGYNLDSNGDLHLHYALMQDTDVIIGLYDLQGRQLSAPQLYFRPAGSYTQSLSLAERPAGEYLLRISVGNKVYGEKIIK